MKVSAYHDFNWLLIIFLPGSGWPGEPSQKGKEKQSALHWKSNHAMVRLTLHGTRIHPQKENSPPWFEVSECVFDEEQLCQTGWFRNLKSTREHCWCRPNSIGYALLHVSWSLPVQALFVHVWCLVSWLHSLWALYAPACVLWRKSIGSGVQNCLG